MIWGALGMFVCEMIVAIIGVIDGQSKPAVSAMIGMSSFPPDFAVDSQC